MENFKPFNLEHLKQGYPLECIISGDITGYQIDDYDAWKDKFDRWYTKKAAPVLRETKVNSGDDIDDDIPQAGELIMTITLSSHRKLEIRKHKNTSDFGYYCNTCYRWHDADAFPYKYSATVMDDNGFDIYNGTMTTGVTCSEHNTRNKVQYLIDIYRDK